MHMHMLMHMLHMHMYSAYTRQVDQTLPPSFEDEPPPILAAIRQVLSGGQLSLETFLEAVAGAPKPRRHNSWERAYEVVLLSHLVAGVAADYTLLQGGRGSYQVQAKAAGLADPKELKKAASRMRGRIITALRASVNRVSASAPGSDGADDDGGGADDDDGGAGADADANDEPPPKRTCKPYEVHHP